MTPTTYQRHGVEPEVLAAITLDSPRFIPADARHVSRLLKAAGLQRSDSPKSQYQEWGFGFHVTGNDLSVHGVGDYNRDKAIALITKAVDILQEKGFVTISTGRDGLYQAIFKPVKTEDDKALFWANLRSGAYVSHGDLLIDAYQAPALKAERDAIRKRTAQRAAEIKAQAEADRLHAENLRKNLEKAGLPCSVHGNWIHVHAGQLNAWLQSQGVHLGKI